MYANFMCFGAELSRDGKTAGTGASLGLSRETASADGGGANGMTRVPAGCDDCDREDGGNDSEGGMHIGEETHAGGVT